MAQDRVVDFDERIVLDDGPEVASGAAPTGKVTEDHQRPDSGRSASGKRMARVKIIVPIVALLLAAVAALSYHYYAGWGSTDDAQIDGYINPISSRVAGYITHVYVDDNQYVKAGTLLAQIDPKDYEVAVASAQATLDNDQATADASQVNVPVISVNTSSQLVSAEADVANARAGISGAEQQLAAAQAAVLQAEANNAKSQDDVKRYKQLVDKQEISEQVYVQAVQTSNGATAAAHRTRYARLSPSLHRLPLLSIPLKLVPSRFGFSGPARLLPLPPRKNPRLPWSRLTLTWVTRASLRPSMAWSRSDRRNLGNTFRQDSSSWPSCLWMTSG